MISRFRNATPPLTYIALPGLEDYVIAHNFVVGVSDSGNLTGTTTMLINVTPSAAIVASISLVNTNLLINWTGGSAPYQVQVLSDLSLTNWENLGGPTSSNSILITPPDRPHFTGFWGTRHQCKGAEVNNLSPFIEIGPPRYSICSKTNHTIVRLGNFTPYP